MTDRAEHGEPGSPRVPALFVFGGVVAAAISLLAAAVEGPPYLALDGLSAWIVVFAIGAFVALFAAAFMIHRTVVASVNPSGRWEAAAGIWAGVALVVGAIGVLLLIAGGSPGSSLAGAAGLVLAFEAAVVVGIVLATMLAG